MKQKIVVGVSINGQKSRSKALKVAVSLSGVESAALGGKDKSQIEVTGEGVDAVELATLLRKNVGHAEIISVSAEGEKKEEKKEETKPEEPTVQLAWPYHYGGPAALHYVYEVGDGYHQQYPDSSTCSVM